MKSNIFCLLLVTLFFVACEKDNGTTIDKTGEIKSEFADLNVTVMLNDGENGQSCVTPGSHEYGIEDAEVFLYDKEVYNTENAQFISKKMTDRTGLATFQQLPATEYQVVILSCFGSQEKAVRLYRGEKKHMLVIY